MIVIFMVVEFISFSVRPVGADVTVWGLHQNLKIGHRLKIIQISLWREKASVGRQHPAGRPSERLRALDRHAQTIEHDVCVTVL